jgi:biopolymer transport protein ExbD
MKLARPTRAQHSETIIALIDVVFFLLVFFMLIGRMDATAPFDVSPPVAATGADMPSGGITLSVGETGEFALDGNRIADGDLDQILSDRLAKDATTLVRINAHRHTELRHVLPMVGRIEALGARDVVLVVTPETAPPN